MLASRSIFLVLTLLLAVRDACAGDPLLHEITATVSPEDRRLSARDRIQGLDSGALELELAAPLEVLGVRAADLEMEFSRRGEKLLLQIPSPPPEAIEISYEGRLYRIPGEPAALSVGTGNVYPIHVGEDEVFLHGEGHWYPSLPGSVPGLFTLNLTMKGGLVAVSQGNLEYRRGSSDVEQTRWSSSTLAQGLFVVAGPYRSSAKTINGVTYGVYSRTPDERNANLLIQTSAKFLTYYSDLLGPYPHPAWSLVESSFSGFHLPGVALLDPQVMNQASRLIQPGYLDHYLVHAWLGDYVLPLYAEGNWSEPLVTYLTGHYYRERQGDFHGAENLRIQATERYSMLVPPDEEYTLAAYTDPRETFGSEIAYGKGALFFHLLRRHLGNDTFVETLGRLVAQYGGRTAAWRDIQQVFQAASPDDLDVMFTQWVRRKGGPKLKLENPEFLNREGSFFVTGTIVQEGEAYTLPLPVRVETALGELTQIVPVRDRETPFEIAVSSGPASVELDPDYHVFRVLDSRNIHPNLARLLQETSHTYVRGPDAASAPVESLLRLLREKKGGWIIGGDELSESLGLGSVFIAGQPPLLGLHGIGKPELEFHSDGFVFRGKEYSGPGQAILYSFDNPFLPGSTVTIFAGNSPDAMAYAAYVPYYSNDTYVIFEYGSPLERGYLAFSPPSTSFHFPERNRLN